MLKFTDQEIQKKAEELGLVQKGERIPAAAMRNRVVAALVEERRAQAPRPPAPSPQMAQEVVVQPKGPILIDGDPFPWLVTDEPMDIRLAADGSGTVRLTLATSVLQIIKPEPKKEETTS